MAGSSASISHSESHSDTYIPEYSQTPILQEIALHARAMSDYVYNWGMERFNKNQGDIDGLMRDALSYASPQRIAVDMGMAEAGVQQAAERGRLSAIKDLESYGIDPSSGRYAALDMSNRVMSAAAAAGAGNQQRMADYAAGNAMRNQAMAAGLQNAQFGLGVGGLANQYLQTASSLKYPPLGRYSDSVSDSQSRSEQTDPGGSKSQPAKDEKPPPQQQEKPAPQPPAGKPAAPAKPSEIIKPPPKEPEKPKEPDAPKPPDDPNRVPKPEEYEDKMPPIPDPAQPDFSDLKPPFDESQMPPIPDPAQPDFSDIKPDQTAGDESAGLNTGPPAETPTGMDMDFNPWANVPDQGEAFPAGDVERGPDLPAPAEGDTMADAYDPYQENIQTAAFEDNQGQIDPVTGEPIETTEAEGGQDVAGSLYGLEGGDWTFDGDMPTAADWGGGTETVADFGDQSGTYDSTMDTWTTDETGDQGGGAGITDADYSDEPGGGDWSFDDYTDTEGQFDTGDYGDYDDTNYNQDYGDYGDEGDYDYTDDYGDDYADDTTDDYADEDYADDYTDDYADEDYADDYEDDAGDDSYEDYTDDDYEDTSDDDYEDTSDDSDDSWSDDSDDSWSDDSDDSWSDDGGGGGGDDGDYARGGPVRKRRRRMATGFRPRPPRMARGGRVPGIQRSGQMPGMARPGQMPGMQRPNPRMGQRMDPPPVPPQPPRPPRGMPMPARGGPRPAPMRTGMNAMPPGNMISANGMPPPTMGGMPRPQRMARGGAAGGRAEPTRGGFVSNELSPSGGSKVDDVEARLNAGEFVIPKDVAHWKGKEFFYKLIAQARKMRSGDGAQKSPTGQNNSPRPQNNSPRPRTGYGAPR